jgi:hypothetical protein
MMRPANDINGQTNAMRVGRPIITYNGITFWPLDPRIDEVNIEDIAHSLSMQCRFNGHLRCFYSVSEHSVRVAAQCSPENALWGLLHDASEAYLTDLPAPIKEEMPDYKKMERIVQAVICEKFGLPIDEPAEVKKNDIILRVTEMRDLRKNGHITIDYNKIEPLPGTICPWGQEEAKKILLQVFNSLT